ncbi:Scr1 family TA system antitoxin-like transcriptional regulator [Streptomyces decoyicus]|uniref:Scr1 family TA system antitoxin-like transcriptional regulator n=1 Tax=Streptomyces decoyicus TaxID=249567 RepID=UPI00365F0314
MSHSPEAHIEGGIRRRHQPTPIEESPSPSEIVIGVYLRALRKALRRSLADTARHTQLSTSTICRVERAEPPTHPRDVAKLLRYYEADGPEIQYLTSNLPMAQHASRQEQRAAGADAVNNAARRGPWDLWDDTAPAGVARYVAVSRVASEAVQYTLNRVPPGYRTPEYRSVVTNPDVCSSPDEPFPDTPVWLTRVGRPPGQRRTLLLDETALYKPVGSAGAMARQLRHLLRLMDGMTTAGPVTIRVRPRDGQISLISSYDEVAELTVSGHRIYTAVTLWPWYETRSGLAQALHRSLHQAVEQAPGHQASYDLIKQAADHWAKQAVS